MSFETRIGESGSAPSGSCRNIDQDVDIEGRVAAWRNFADVHPVRLTLKYTSSGARTRAIAPESCRQSDELEQR